MNEIRETSLRDERAAAESERRKNELVAYLAHDIRTPLTSVVGYLSLLDEAPDLPEEQRKRYVSTALTRAETLDELTAEFFEITRYNLSSIPIERTEVNASLFVQQVIDEYLPLMQPRSVTPVVHVPDDESIYIDAGKMARAMGNVMRNAVAYAREGTELNVEAIKSKDNSWKISVSNEGVEIAPEHLEMVFDQFFRADAARPSSGHAGLGLAIAKEIIEAHGGTIYAESSNGLTTFTISLPNSPQASQLGGLE